MSLSELLQPGMQGSDRNSAAPSEKWRPQLELGEDGGFLVSTPRTAVEQPDAADLLAEFDLDPQAWRVTGIRRSRWQRHDGEWLEAYRVSLVPAGSRLPDTDIEQLIDEVRKWRPAKGSRPETGDLGFIVATADMQLGKDAGDGTEGTVRRFQTGVDASVQRLKDLRRTGRRIGTVVLPQMGDCIEGSVSQNGKVLGRSDITSITAQVRLGRRLLMHQLKTFAQLADTVVVPAVPGNHDEPQRLLLTDPVDSWQVDIVSAVQDACAENPELSHIVFRYPERDDPTIAVDVHGTVVGFAHGHQSRDAVKWWHGQAIGRTPVGTADVLVTAHFHHYKVQQVGERLWVQCPALDGGSPWFRNRTGQESPAGLLTFTAGAGHDPRLDLSVLAGEYR